MVAILADDWEYLENNERNSEYNMHTSQIDIKEKQIQIEYINPCFTLSTENPNGQSCPGVSKSLPLFSVRKNVLLLEL